VHKEAYFLDGIYIGTSNQVIFDQSGNLIIGSITIPVSKLSNIQYLDINTSLTSLINTINSNITTNTNNITTNTTNITTNTNNITTNTTNITTNTNAISSINSTLTSKANISYVDSSIANLIGTSPTLLNTLQEIDNAINNDPNFATSITNLIATKQDIVNNIGYFDISSSLTSLLNSKQNTLSNASYLDVTSSTQTQLNSKQPTLTSSTALLGTSLNGTALTNISNLPYLDVSSSLTSLLNAKQNTISNISYFDINSSLTTQLNSKQATLSNASYLDFTSSGQTQINNINTSLSGKQATLSNASYLDVTSSAQTQLNSKQATITTATNLSINNLTCAGTVSLPNNSLTTAMISGYSSGISASSANTFTQPQTFSAQTNLSQVGESFIAVTGTASPFTLNFASGSVQYIPSDYSTGLAANFNLKITNIPLQTAGSKSYTFSVVYKNSNKVFANNLIIQDTGNNYLCGSAAATYITPLYSGGTAPTITSSNMIIQSFTLFYILNSSGTLTSTNILTSVSAFA
jgi:hypothetical protein